MARKECIAIVIIIIIPPIIVSGLGLSFITIQTHIGPIITSNKKNKFTSAAVINLGAIVTSTNGIATHKTHINGTIIISESTRLKFFTNINAKSAVFVGKKELENNMISIKLLHKKSEQLEIDMNNITQIKAILEI